jgi:Domain of Unknown Function (DUF1080)
MLKIFLPVCLVALCVFCSSLHAQEKAQSLFDGKTLDNWKGIEKFWSVKDGAITGQTTKENPTDGNTFLVWQGGKVANFELSLKYRIVEGNSGIQYRSEDVGNFTVKGYQADIDYTNNFIGILYGERTDRGIIGPRGKKIKIDAENKTHDLGASCDEKEFMASIKKDGWNEYTIIADGNHLVHKINGFATVDVTDEHKAAVSEGILALQLHAGPPMLVQFKDITLKKLK